MDIGFIGLGNMGYSMARRLVEAGHKLVVYDTSGQMMSRLTSLGAVAAKLVVIIGHDKAVAHSGRKLERKLVAVIETWRRVGRGGIGEQKGKQKQRHEAIVC